MDSRHLFLFATMMNNGRFSIRDFNPGLPQWNELKDAGFCSILEGGRAGTLIIHPTEKAVLLADSILCILESNK